jgi:hypothetical protein
MCQQLYSAWYDSHTQIVLIIVIMRIRDIKDNSNVK